MSFVLQQIDGVRVGLREIRRDELLIGRGTNAHVRSENAALAFEHATISVAGDGWELVDRGSITGTYLNGRPVERAHLKKGDRIEAADLRLDVQVAERGRPLFLRLERMEIEEAWTSDARPAADAASPAGGAALVAPKKDYAAAYRLGRRFWSRGLLTVAATLVAAVAVATVAGRGRLDAFSPGPLSAAHAGARLQNGRPLFPAQHCAACHTPFGGPSDARCEECHAQAFHQASLAKSGSCGTCHAEHRSIARLSAVHQAECLSCHRDLGKVSDSPRVAKSIASFGADHPPFTLAQAALPGNQRVPLAQAAARRLDRNGLRFDHACHTGGKCNVRPPQPGDPRRVTETLECTSCHQVDGATGSITLLRYEESCARCHPLTFDNRFSPVPHGLGLDAMAGVVANAYAGNRDLLNKTPDEVARIFARSRPRAVDTDSATVRNAQRLLRVRCEQCHELRQGAVVPVRASRQWFAGMRRFDHRPHLNESLRITCTDCHASATASKSSADVLVPDIDRCRSCHGEESARDEGLAACTTCHYYHAASSRFGAGWTAKTITASLTPSAARPTPAPAEPRSGGSFVRIMSIFTLFLLAVAAFVALFWVWRRFERSETADTSLALHGQGEGTPPAPPRSPAPAAPRAPAPPPPPPAAPAPPPAAPLHPQSPPPEPTVAINLRPPEPEAPAGGTVVIEWVGVLVGITGPYKGKKIPIDPAGFYIGRDKELSTIVVDDPRISRRHVWIGVKNGKVVAVEQGSTNGTFLNNVGSAPIAEVELKAGDVLILADQAASFRFEP